MNSFERGTYKKEVSVGRVSLATSLILLHRVRSPQRPPRCTRRRPPPRLRWLRHPRQRRRSRRAAAEWVARSKWLRRRQSASQSARSSSCTRWSGTTSIECGGRGGREVSRPSQVIHGAMLPALGCPEFRELAFLHTVWGTQTQTRFKRHKKFVKLCTLVSLWKFVDKWARVTEVQSNCPNDSRSSMATLSNLALHVGGTYSCYPPRIWNMTSAQQSS